MTEKVIVCQKVIDAYQTLLDKHQGNSLAVVYEWSEKLLPHKTDSVWKDVDWFTLLALITGNYKVSPEKVAKTEVEHLREMLRNTRKTLRHKVSEVKTLQNACKKHKAKQAALEFQLKVSIMHAQELDAELEAEVAENEQLREALEFYSDETKYERVELCDGDKEIYIERDGGEIARQALWGETNE
ncbi:hypothetical protein FC756_18515 [Lysinibacillus mangiferihumi]|uniref:Uncharacterized protein n=1 Tax=Lysinibacillus mangiferihumi TaxID=1130819 RepID=A0A4U2YQ50_9BACI|nr:hypothetical protein [Lysinibacillus mangiferihumi]TKI63180.1 hypothetical protein FC756_18515 [Lysinibacillus mangiferihumi]